MDLHTWLDARPGSMTALAQKLGITHSAVSQWRSNGVPLRHMQAVAEFTNNEVTLFDLAAEAARAAASRYAEKTAA